MALYVIKFGGTSVATIDRIQHAASIVNGYVIEGHSVIVVVSAMAGMTNQLIEYTETLTINGPSPEYDVVAASGEQITAGLMALALQKKGLNAQSLLAHQIPIETDNCHTNARIKSIDAKNLRALLQENIIPVVAGFQGITYHNTDDNSSHRLTTLGRGGSDTTAVALAATLNADRCYIYTDVRGVFTSDPRAVPHAHKIDCISYEEMLELASKGAKVLHNRSVELAMRYNVELCILSSFEPDSGTIVKENPHMETPQLSGIAHSLNEALVIFSNPIETSPQNDPLTQLYKYACEHSISIDLLTYSPSQPLTFTIQKNELERAKPLFESIKSSLGFTTLAIDLKIVTLTLVGVGIGRDKRLLPFLLETLTQHSIPLCMMSVQEIKITLIIPYDYMTKALTVLHEALFNSPNK